MHPVEYRESFFSLITFLLLLSSCNYPQGTAADPSDSLLEAGSSASSLPTGEQDFSARENHRTGLIYPKDLEYLGAFRLPAPSGGSSWEYSGHGLTFYPDGDPAGEEDGFPGSLFGFGHDHQLLVSEISIPAPVISKNPADLPTALTLQPFSDLTAGIFQAEQMTIPRAGIAYLADPAPRLHFTFGQHIQDFEPSHGWAEIDLAANKAAGPWRFNGYTNYVSNDYLFEIPPEWAHLLGGGPLLASGRAREGLWSGRGPALFAYAPGDLHSPLPPGGEITSVIPLLLYGEQQPGMPDLSSDPSRAVTEYREADHWWGGEWLTAGDRSAVVLAGTKALGEEWYGFANGVVWEYDCAEHTPPTCPDPPEWPYDNRGFWAEGFQAQLIFYDPHDLVQVARGELESWQPQPYAVLVLDDYLFDPRLRVEDYKRDYLGAMAFDRQQGLIYLIERLADEYQSLIHVWRINL